MTKRGRKPKALKELAGNPGKRPIKAEAKAIKGIPDCPTWLDEVAKAEWQRITPLLDQMGTVSHTDYSALIRYCNAFADYVEARLHLRESGATYKSKDTNSPYEQKSVWRQIADKTYDQLVKAEVELGLTPASRHKANVIADTTVGKFAKFGLGAQ